MIQRPKSKELDAIFATVEQIRRAEAQLVRLKEQVAREAQALANIPDRGARIAAGFYAYWFAHEVNATDIALGATGQAHPGKLLKLAGAVSFGVPCDRCGGDLPIRSRAQMKDTLNRRQGPSIWPEGFRVLCEECEAAVHHARRREHDEVERLREARLREVSAMSYPDYLATEDWAQVKAGRLLLEFEERYAFGCETCGSAATLGLYHKNLDGIGEADDLILLCNSCRDALLERGKLAGQPGERNCVTAAEIRQVVAAHHQLEY